MATVMRVSCGSGMSTSRPEQDGAAGQAAPRQGPLRREARGLTREATVCWAERASHSRPT